MKFIGYYQLVAITLLLLPSLLASSDIIAMESPESAETKNINRTLQKWDRDFFSYDCPGVAQTVDSSAVLDSELEITSNAFVRPSSGIVSFEGNVQLQYGDKFLSADAAQLDKINNTFIALGHIRYQDTQLRLTTDFIDLDFTEQSGDAKQSKFQLKNSNLRGEAKAISIKANQTMSISDVGLTSCPPGNESWLFETSKVDVDPKSGWGKAEDVVLKIYDIPVFYLPSISFPVDDRRKSGLLYPSIGRSSRNGLEIEVPWYWNIASDKDATFTARYLNNRGLMLGAEYRQLTENTETKIFTEYLPNDDEGLSGDEDRFFYQINTDYSSGDHWRGDLELKSVSDDYYFYDFGGNFNSGNINLLRRFAQVRFDDQNISFRGTFSDDKLLSTVAQPYSRLPQLQLSLLYPEIFAGLTTNIHMEATAFRHENAVEADRITVIPELSMPLYWSSGYIKPQLKLNYSHYSQDDPTNILPDSINRAVPIFSVDSTMFFERQVDLYQQKFVQTLEPRLFYLYVPAKEQNEIALFDTTSVNNGVDSLFRENRYSGYDRIGDSNQLSLAVTSRFYEQVSGRERMRLTMGRAYYLEDREVNLAIYQNGNPAIDLGIDKRANSALITNLQLGFYDHWWLKGELEYDESNSRTEKGVLGLQYRSSDLLINLRHRLNRYTGSDDIEQSEISFALPVKNGLSFVGRWQHDIRNNRTIDSFAGLEYESCCWAIRLVARRYLNIRLDRRGVPVPGIDEFNNGIYLEFILKGLTNVGKGLNLEKDIQGYDERFSN